MKKLFYVFVLLTGSVSLYAAETVSSVSFNPSRMGDYTYLKVANKATLKGGLKTPEMNISVGGTISAEYSPNDSSRVYVINQLMGNPTSAIDMEQAVFHGNIAAQYTGYKSESSLLPAGLLPLVTIYGGNQTYLNDSYIQTLDAVNMLRQRAGELKSTALSVLGSGGGTASLYNGGSTYGLHLAGNDIPEPTGSHTNTGKDLSNCTLVWEKRKTSTTPAKEVWLLALKNCSASGTPTPDPDPEPEDHEWVNSTWKVVDWFPCGASGEEQAAELCKSYPNQKPSGFCYPPGQTVEAFCNVNDYCPGQGVAAEVGVYVCQ